VKKLALIVLAAFAVIFSVQAQQGQPQPPNPGNRNPEREAAQAAAAERGRALFQQNCAVCHGEDATGGRGPDLIRSSVVRHDKNGDLIGPVVTQGRADRGMPAFPFGQDQIVVLLAFIQAQLDLFDLHTRVGPYPNDIPAERLATGTVEAGKAFFNGAGGCSKCHSPTGDLAGIATKYNPPNLEQRLLYPGGVPPTAIVTLPSGKQFEGTLVLNDDYHVAIQGKDGWYHSWSRGTVKKVEVTDPLKAHAELLEKYTDADLHNIFTYLETLK
jgi:cytochrome c oxidase cbb3-type subunit 3